MNNRCTTQGLWKVKGMSEAGDAQCRREKSEAWTQHWGCNSGETKERSGQHSAASFPFWTRSIC